MSVGGLSTGRSGCWCKDRIQTPQTVYFGKTFTAQADQELQQLDNINSLKPWRSFIQARDLNFVTR